VILLAGGTGRLGKVLVPILTAQGLPVKVLTRNPSAARHLPRQVQVVPGDLRDAEAVQAAMTGVTTVVSAVQAGFGATGGSNPTTVDWQGNQNLIQAAKADAVQHFVLVSIIDASPEHPLPLWRMKYAAEQELRTSGLTWTVIRGAAFMEWCVEFIGVPLWTNGRTRVFGRGDNPINFISARDIAGFVELAVTSPALRDTLVTVAGPENITFNEAVERIRTQTGAVGPANHVPLPVMRAMSAVMAVVNPAMAREIDAGIYLDTADRGADGSAVRVAYPLVPTTTFEEVVRSYHERYKQRA
jgi:uncharacterized protein YbjT (DUF2867 family)